MDFIKFLFKKYPALLIPALVVFYFIRTSQVNLTNDVELSKVIKQELLSSYLKQHLSSNLTPMQANEIENNIIEIEKLIGKYSASSFVTTKLYLKTYFHTSSDSRSQSIIYRLRYDIVTKQWYIENRNMIDLSWKVAL